MTLFLSEKKEVGPEPHRYIFRCLDCDVAWRGPTEDSVCFFCEKPYRVEHYLPSREKLK